MGLRCQVSTFDSCFIFRRTGSAAGAFATHTGDILGQESPSEHVGMELVRGNGSSDNLAQDEFAQNLKPLPRPRSYGRLDRKRCQLET